jgi:hypothetical protein
MKNNVLQHQDVHLIKLLVMVIRLLKELHVLHIIVKEMQRVAGLNLDHNVVLKKEIAKIV